MAAAVVRALRGRRGPVAAAMALGRLGLGGASPFRSPPLMMRRSIASGNKTGTGDGGMGAVCADCSREILALRAEMLRENHELSVQCAKLGVDNVDLREMIVMNQSKAHAGLNKLTFQTLASGVAGVVGVFAFFMAPFVKESWKAKRKEPTLAEAMSPTEEIVSMLAHKEEVGGAQVKAKSRKEEEVGGALVKAKSPKEEEGGGGGCYLIYSYTVLAKICCLLG